MSQLAEQIQIITTPDSLKAVLTSLLGELPSAQLSPAVVELEVLKRKEYLTTEEVGKLYPLNPNTLRKRRMNYFAGKSWCRIISGQKGFTRKKTFHCAPASE